MGLKTPFKYNPPNDLCEWAYKSGRTLNTEVQEQVLRNLLKLMIRKNRPGSAEGQIKGSAEFKIGLNYSIVDC